MSSVLCKTIINISVPLSNTYLNIYKPAPERETFPYILTESLKQHVMVDYALEMTSTPC